MKQLLILVLTISFCNLCHGQLTNINGPAGSGQFGTSVVVLTNGNYVITDPLFDDGPLTDVGAVYLYNGTTHTLISTLKGSSPNDNVGSNGVLALGNGNFVVMSTLWDNGAATNAGAVTFGNGTTGVAGIVSSSNSLVGSTTNDNVGSSGVVDAIVISGVRSGNYIVRSPLWDNGAAANAGAITWGNATTGVSGAISSINSLVGSSANDNVGAINVLSFGTSSSSLILRAPDWDNGGVTDAGAVAWFNGLVGISGVLGSTNSLVGTTAGDKVGFVAPTVLSNGNYVVRTATWDNGAIADAGAVTWGSGSSGVTGVINSSNSLIGNTAGDAVGSDFISVLNNGNYVVGSSHWRNGAVTEAGAVTWGNGATGISGIVSSGNSLVGSSANDNIGNFGVFALGNSNYIVRSPHWDNGIASNAGAVTWVNGVTGMTGAVSSSNSLVGSTSDDRVGSDDGTITMLNNNNYVIRSPYWDNGTAVNAGAATWANGASGITGTVSSGNSLVGTASNDFVSNSGIMALSNGNYIVRSANWANGSNANTGAVTWGDGTMGISGVVTGTNSLIGATANDFVGFRGIQLDNGNYVIGSPFWNNAGATDAGAVTWCDGNAGTSGVVNGGNSLTGSSAGDGVGGTITALLNSSNYLSIAGGWDNGAAANAGAVTWCNGSGPVAGAISSTNSLVGGSANDGVGNLIQITANAYIVTAANWDNGAAVDAGAVTIASSLTGVSGVVSSSNSATGSQANDRVGSGVVLPVNNNFIIASPLWDNGSQADAGAVTWVNGSTSSAGAVSSANSLVGSKAGDNVGNAVSLTSVLSSTHYMVRSANWDNGAVVNTGAVTFGNGSAGVTGTITACNSVPGLIAAGGSTLINVYSTVYDYMIVGKRQENLVVVYNPAGMQCAVNGDNNGTNINGNNQVPLIAGSACRIIASLQPNGANPVSGTVNARVWIEPAVPAFAGKPFLARHYEVTPLLNASTATGRLTLYFLQQEFNDFNVVSNILLPTGPADVAGKANLRIQKTNGTSSDGSGMPYTYSGNAAFIDPPDENIVWNALLNRWEITLDVTGFSGFFVSAGNSTNFSTCASAVNQITTGVTGTTYQWQVNSGSGYTNLADGGFYVGASTSALTITGLPTSSYGYKYRCVVDGAPGEEYEVKFFAVWAGETNTDWFTTSNWSGCGVVPDEYTDVIVPGGRVNYPVINTTTTIGSLKAETGASITIQSGVNVTVKR